MRLMAAVKSRAADPQRCCIARQRSCEATAMPPPVGWSVIAASVGAIIVVRRVEIAASAHGRPP